MCAQCSFHGCQQILWETPHFKLSETENAWPLTSFHSTATHTNISYLRHSAHFGPHNVSKLCQFGRVPRPRNAKANQYIYTSLNAIELNWAALLDASTQNAEMINRTHSQYRIYSDDLAIGLVVQCALFRIVIGLFVFSKKRTRVPFLRPDSAIQQKGLFSSMATVDSRKTCHPLSSKHASFIDMRPS